MNLLEKIGSLFMVGFDGTKPPDSLRELIVDYHVGGVILFRRNIESKKQLVSLIAQIKSMAAGRPMLIAVDHEGGRVFRMPEPFTQFPPMASVTDPEAAYNIGKIMAQELKGVGFNINFAPVLDVNTNIKNPVIGDRSFSHNPSRVAQLGTALICGLQENGIIACGKHFPGHGDTYRDSHTSLPTLPHTMARLETIELVPFIAAIEAGVRSIMTAHIIFDGIDHNMPATMSVPIIGKLLRQDLNYNGVVFTDDLNMSAISKKWTLPEACLNSLQAGCDICLICRDNVRQKEAIEYVANAAASGKLPESLIKTAYRRISTKLFDFIEK